MCVTDVLGHFSKLSPITAVTVGKKFVDNDGTDRFTYYHIYFAKRCACQTFRESCRTGERQKRRRKKLPDAMTSFFLHIFYDAAILFS